jgi:hypothetical protein
MAKPESSEEALEQLDLVVSDSLGVKLGAGTPEHTGALAVAGAGLFDPGGVDRPFKDWVSLPLDASAEWVPFAGYALAFAARR